MNLATSIGAIERSDLFLRTVVVWSYFWIIVFHVVLSPLLKRRMSVSIKLYFRLQFTLAVWINACWPMLLEFIASFSDFIVHHKSLVITVFVVTCYLPIKLVRWRSHCTHLTSTRVQLFSKLRQNVWSTFAVVIVKVLLVLILVKFFLLPRRRIVWWKAPAVFLGPKIWKLFVRIHFDTLRSI